jgi:carboxynorspermidine decarboxylase
MAYYDELDLTSIPSPCFIIDEAALEDNLICLRDVADKSGAKILIALKAFSMWSLAPLVSKYLDGTCSSGLFESRLAEEEYKGENHVFSSAYSQSDIDELLVISDYLIFNSGSQWLRFKEQCLSAQKRRPTLQFGLRINPEHSEGTMPVYDPCLPGSRLGMPVSELNKIPLDGISGLHFHNLCEQGVENLERTLSVVVQKFGHLFDTMSWINFGGGHLITSGDYDIKALVKLIKRFTTDYGLQVYLEPGEAIGLNAGVLTCEVLDISWNKLDQAILNVSPTCHMPDVLEMPFRPQIVDADFPRTLPYTYRLGGFTCLAGDVLGDYSFDKKLAIGQTLIIKDMAHYSMVKTTTFNGSQLPAIAIRNSKTNTIEMVKEFGYQDFKGRLS